MPRRVADRFRLERPLGSGAMGAVFAAVDEQNGQPCAIKIIHPHIAKTGVNAERFRREVTLAQQVGHPGIVRVYDAGHDPETGLFMVMELLQGVTFRPPLSQGELTVAQALEVVSAMLDALQAAHRLGIVHRDLKPDNIFLHAPPGELPRVKLLDFGVARHRNTAGLTTTNVGLGTPHFMAPEQAADARSVTPASDVWSAGVMLYYILTGALPFDGEGPYETVLRACTVPHTPLDRLAPEIDVRLRDVVEICLEKDPQERFQDAGELGEVLTPLLGERAVLAPLAEVIAAEPRETPDSPAMLDLSGVQPPLANALSAALVGAAPPLTAAESGPVAPPPSAPAPGRSRWVALAATVAGLAIVSVAAGLTVRKVQTEPLPAPVEAAEPITSVSPPPPLEPARGVAAPEAMPPGAPSDAAHPPMEAGLQPRPGDPASKAQGVDQGRDGPSLADHRSDRARSSGRSDGARSSGRSDGAGSSARRRRSSSAASASNRAREAEARSTSALASVPSELSSVDDPSTASPPAPNEALSGGSPSSAPLRPGRATSDIAPSSVAVAPLVRTATPAQAAPARARRRPAPAGRPSDAPANPEEGVDPQDFVTF